MTIILMIIAIIILIIATIKYPPISLAFYLTTNLFKAVLVFKFSFFRAVDYTLLCALLVLFAMACSFVKSSGRLKNILSIPLLVYLLLATILLLGTTYTSAPNYGLEKSVRFATLGLIAFLAPIVFAHSVKEIKLMMWILFIVGISISIITIISPYGSVLRESPEGRGAFLESGPLGTAVKMAAAAIIAFVFAIMTRTSKQLRAVSLISIALIIVGIITTASRGPLVGLGLTYLVAIFICRKGISKAWLPGSTLSGEKASQKSLPGSSPERSSNGSTTCLVVPG